MRTVRTALIAAALLGLSGCHKMETAFDSSDQHHGRYAGIGLFEPSKIWSHLQGEASKDPAAAKPEDDDMVIVVVDSDTGEVRECGNYSGRCVSMNPWTNAVAPQRHTPVAVSAHAAELANESTAKDVNLDDKRLAKPAKPAAAKNH